MSFEEYIKQEYLEELRNHWICPHCGRFNSLNVTECQYCCFNVK